jgi:hypothetical protein
MGGITPSRVPNPTLPHDISASRRARAGKARRTVWQRSHPLRPRPGLPFVMRGKDYQVLLQTEVQFRLSLPADQQFSRPESAYVRTLYDCPQVTVGANGERCRVVVATHPAGVKKPRVGVERDGIVYELFLTALPQEAFTAADVVALASHIAVRLKTHFPMKIRSKILIVGAVMPPGARNAGKSSASGLGTCGWSWAITCSRSRCAPPSLPPLISLGRLRLPTYPRLYRAMGLPRSPRPGRRVASRVATLPFSLMARCAVPPGKSSQHTSGVGKPMGACG